MWSLQSLQRIKRRVDIWSKGIHCWVGMWVCGQLLYQDICIIQPFLLFDCWQRVWMWWSVQRGNHDYYLVLDEDQTVKLKWLYLMTHWVGSRISFICQVERVRHEELPLMKVYYVLELKKIRANWQRLCKGLSEKESNSVQDGGEQASLE